MDNRFLFIGGDRRSIYAAQAIMQRRTVNALGLVGFPPASGRYGAVVLPLPFLINGKINAPQYDAALPLSLVTEYAESGGTVFSGGSSSELIQLCTVNGLKLVDYYAQEPLTLKNAALTAEAALALIIQNTEFSLGGSNAVITGGGRIALICARYLRSLGCNVCVCARNAEQRVRAELEFNRSAELPELQKLCESADVIINTVPAELFSEEHFRLMSPSSLFVELASVDPTNAARFADKYGVRYIFASGLPGKISPKTAGEAIAEVILANA